LARSVELESLKKEAAAVELPAPASFHLANAALVEPLTSRELEVLYLIAEGMTNQQMAEKLVISVGTAKWYTSQIYGKLNVTSRTQAVARARELALLS
jgi:LuxR family maltose regulon positive regulatory protein